MLFYVVAPGLSSANTNASLVKFFLCVCVCVCVWGGGIQRAFYLL